MGERTHTKGPWVEFADKGETVALMAAGRPEDVCEFAKPYPSRADARLMRAAPDLFEALSWAMAELDGLTLYDHPKQREECLARARLALAKVSPHV